MESPLVGLVAVASSGTDTRTKKPVIRFNNPRYFGLAEAMREYKVGSNKFCQDEGCLVSRRIVYVTLKAVFGEGQTQGMEVGYDCGHKRHYGTKRSQGSRKTDIPEHKTWLTPKGDKLRWSIPELLKKRKKQYEEQK